MYEDRNGACKRDGETRQNQQQEYFKFELKDRETHIIYISRCHRKAKAIVNRQGLFKIELANSRRYRCID